MWWNLFQQDDASLLIHTSSSTYRGVVTLKYADWWAGHGGNFTQRSGAIRHIEKDYLRRQDRPHFHIRERYLKKYFSKLAIHVINAFQAKDKSQKRPLVVVEVEHVDNHPIRKKSASKKRARATAIDPPSSYEWWSDFVHACGLPPDAPLDSLLPPGAFNDDPFKEWLAYLSNVLTSLGPRREAFLIQRACRLDDVWSAVSSDTVSPSRHLAQPETRAGPDISLPIPSPEVANSPHDGADGATFSPHISMHVDPVSTVPPGNTLLIYLLACSLIPTASPEPLLGSLLSRDQNVEPMPPVSEARGGHSREDDVDDWDYELDVYPLMTMMEGPLPTTDRGALQDITAVVEPTATETPPFPSIEGNPLLVSISIALNEEKSEPPAPSHPLPDPSVPLEEKGALAEPLSQPSDPAAIAQDDLSLAPDPSKTNNNGGDSFVPMPLALNLPFVVEKVEVAIKPFEHLLDVENSDVTSPLDVSEPNSSETYVISDDHSLDRSPQALEVLEGRLAALRGEAIGTAGQISMVQDQHTSLLSRQREESARATLLRMLASCLDRSVAEDVRHSIALTVRLLSLEVEQNRIHASIAVLEAEASGSCNAAMNASRNSLLNAKRKFLSHERYKLFYHLFDRCLRGSFIHRCYGHWPVCFNNRIFLLLIGRREDILIAPCLRCRDRPWFFPSEVYDPLGWLISLGADASPLPPFLPRADEKSTAFTSRDPEPLSFGAYSQAGVSLQAMLAGLFVELAEAAIVVVPAVEAVLVVMVGVAVVPPFPIVA
ncbi:hypothetical protein Taro_039640 [Colocasia esculenta]|uniref:Uncharacterized protein n=1 Tax=Colocasia esculenta TaxID=4460 RepID=A0A843WB52_COLES|nr:hypothetical protein [Colocasia esculenta]